MASTTPVAFADLPEELLSLVAEYAVRRGEAFWFAATSRAARRATACACSRVGLPSMRSHLSGIFASTARLRVAMNIEGAWRLAHADMGADGLNTRPVSLDGRYVWSPAGERAMVAAAPVAVLNYAWSGWQRSLDHVNPACALSLVCARGRADLLDHMFALDAGPAASGAPCVAGHGESLYRALALARDGFRPALDAVERAIVCPALNGNARATLEWYYSTMEGLTRDRPTHTAWRNQFQSPESLQRLALSAGQSAQPRQALGLLLDWLSPRLGTRAPSRRAAAADVIACAAIVAVRKQTTASSVGAWRWAEAHQPLGLGALLRRAHDGAFKLPPGWTCSRLQNLARRAESVTVYHWMTAALDAPGGWLYEAFASVNVPWTPSPEMLLVRQRVEAEGGRADLVFAREAVEHGPPAVRSEALADVLLWAAEAPGDAVGDAVGDADVALALRLLEHDVHGFVRALSEFCARCCEAPAWRAAVLGRLLPALTARQAARNEAPVSSGSSVSSVSPVSDSDDESLALDVIIRRLRESGCAAE